MPALICPDCESCVLTTTDGLVCTNCQRCFPLTDGVAVLLPATMDAITTAEVDYWNDRAAIDTDDIAQFYARDNLAIDRWGLYGYAPALFTLSPDDCMLEVGCGTVARAVPLARFHGFRSITVSDLSPQQLVANRAWCVENGLGDAVSHVAADAVSLPFADASFNAVMIHGALHHVPAWRDAVREMVRVLIPGGRIILGHEPNAPMIAMQRRIADWTRLGEKHTNPSYSVADDELAGLRPSEVVGELRALGVRTDRVIPQWFLMAGVHASPIFLRRLGRTGGPPSWAITTARGADRILARIPLLRHYSVHFSLVGTKTAIIE